MFKRSSALYKRIAKLVDSTSVIDTHEHMLGPDALITFNEPIQALIAGYIGDDIQSAGAKNETIEWLRNPNISTDQKWSVFFELWGRIEHSTYARITRYVLQDSYGETELTRDSLNSVAPQLLTRNRDFYDRMLHSNHIPIVLTDSLGFDTNNFEKFLSVEFVYDPRFKPFIPLPLFHVVQHHSTSARNWSGLQRIGSWVDRHIKSLGMFLEAVYNIFNLAIQRGAIGLKDQSAYNRTLNYDVVTRSDAERLFNRMLADPHALLGWSEAKPLDDYLFHQYLRFAAELSLPVQIHTGHMAGGRNRVQKANVSKFVPVIELHQKVQFDLFHGNWPYMGDTLFLTKNYPNVALNFCWLYIVDPYYAKELLKRAIVTVPHTKLHGFGGDYDDIPEYSMAHLRLAREIITATFLELIEDGVLIEERIEPLVTAFLFDNPKTFYRL